MQAQFVKLKCDQVRTLIQVQGLKHWWVAEEAGIHKTTLRRWLSGDIAKIRSDHAARLAGVLTVSTSGIADPLTLP